MAANLIQISGSPKIAVAILGSDGSIMSTSTIDASPCLWSIFSSSDNMPTSSPILSLCGQTVATITTDKSIRYLTSLGNSKATWKHFVPALGSIAVSGMTGDPVNGFTLLGSDVGVQTIYRVSTDSTPVWKALTSPVPFVSTAKIIQIVGDNTNGVVIVSDEDVSNLARLGGAGESWTMLLPKAPIKIELITGDCLNGFIVYGEGQLYSLTVGKDTVWTSLPSTNFSILKISGNPKDGVVALIGDGTIVAYCKDLNKAPWCVAYVPDIDKKST